jgi:hypothetical protein
MIKTLTLEEAIAQVFGVKDVPAFTDNKPMVEARALLDSKKIEYVYERGTVQDNSIVVFSRGASSPMIALSEDNSFKGAVVYGSLAPKTKSKSQERREAIMNDDVESAPVITDSPEENADEEMTVTNPKPSKTTRKGK